jgi:hypothetical protein
VFLAAFILILGGAALAAALAIGLGTRDAVRRHITERTDAAHNQEEHSLSADRTLWNHL